MDPMVGTAVMMIFGLITLVSGLIALVVLVVDRRVSRVAAGTGIASAAIVIGCLMAMPPGYSPGERDRVERLHAQFAPALERYRQTHGDYPATLQAAGIATPQTEYGPLRYHRKRSREGSPAYEISFGDYGQNGFVTWWDSGTQRWSLDQ
jgi:hypothetical protein